MPETRATVTAATLNVRAAPDGSSEKRGALARGASVTVVGRSGSWYEVQSGALRGFAHGDFLHLDTTPAAASGFLCHDDALCACTLPGARAIDTTSLGGATKQAAATWNRFGGLLGPLCAATGIPVAAAVGVLCVESGGQGFVGGRLIIRFENHVFFERWGKAHPDVFRRHFTFDATKRWTGHRFRARESDPWLVQHDGQEREWQAFTIARGLDESAAMRSISMGAPQIMGYHHGTIGYESARAMFDKFGADDRYHILALFDFIKGPGRTSPMLEALRGADYVRFATHYNGNGQAAEYGARIQSAATAFGKVAPS